MGKYEPGIKKKKEEFKKQIMELGEKELKLSFKLFFEENPGIEAIGWTQYTPYFNDGEACVFGVNELYFKLSAELVAEGEKDEQEDEDDSYFEGKRWFCYSAPSVLPLKQAKNCTQLEKDLDGMDEIFEMVFGDHSRVIVSREGFRVFNYDHD